MVDELPVEPGVLLNVEVAEVIDPVGEEDQGAAGDVRQDDILGLAVFLRGGELPVEIIKSKP